MSLLYEQGFTLGCHVKCHYCMCRGVPWGVISRVTIECAGLFLGVSCQVSLLYVKGVPRGLISSVTISCAGMLLGCHVKSHY